MNKLTIKELSKTYSNGVKALDKISLELKSGMFGLLGPNGAGKSSLMRIIAALQEPSSGQLFLNEDDILSNPDQIRNKLGYLPQEFGVYPGHSAETLLNHIALLKGVSETRDRKNQVESLLHQTNLYVHRKKAVSSFSGGMRQRFGIAQALLGDPKIVIVDEPTAGLDPEERNRFYSLLSEVAASVIVILSTHIVEDVRELCTNMAILNEGKLVLEGKPSELLNQLNGKIWSCTISKEELKDYQKDFQVISTCLLAGKTVVHVYSESCPSSEFSSIPQSLEDVYFATLKNLINH